MSTAICWSNLLNRLRKFTTNYFRRKRFISVTIQQLWISWVSYRRKSYFKWKFQPQLQESIFCLFNTLRPNLDDKTSTLIYTTIVTPLLMFNCIINLNLTVTQINRLTSLDNRAKRITNNTKTTPLHDSICKHACKIVKKVITGDICSNLKGYFEVNNQSKQTRNANFLLKVPRIKLETARSSFYYMGVKFYNDLPLNLRKVELYKEFERQLKLNRFESKANFWMNESFYYTNDLRVIP